MHGCRAQVLVAADYVELGPRLKRSSLECVILQGSQLCRSYCGENFHNTTAAGRASCCGRPDRGCYLRPTTSSSAKYDARSRTPRPGFADWCVRRACCCAVATAFAALVLSSTCSPSRPPRPATLAGVAPPPELSSRVGARRAPLAPAHARSAAVRLSGRRRPPQWRKRPCVTRSRPHVVRVLLRPCVCSQSSAKRGPTETAMSTSSLLR